jgi:hypothetical protein
MARIKGERNRGWHGARSVGRRVNDPRDLVQRSES